MPVLQNNLLSAPNDNTAAIKTGTGVTLISDHNLVTQGVSTVFTSSTPAVATDFALKSGSTAIGYGTAVPVWDDYIKATRATTWDAGAYKY